MYEKGGVLQYGFFGPQMSLLKGKGTYKQRKESRK